MVTLLQLRTQTRQRADMERNLLVSDSELNSYINNSIAELYDILVEAYGAEYYVTSCTFSTVVNQQAYPLPDGTLYNNAPKFYELKGVDVMTDNQTWLNVNKFNFNERNRFSDFTIWDIIGIINVRYRLIGPNISFNPMPDRVAQIQLWYVPLPVQLVADSDTLDDLNAYSEYVIVDSAIKMLQKEESDVSVLMSQKEALKKRITDKAQNRDSALSPTVSDIYAENTDFFWRNGY